MMRVVSDPSQALKTMAGYREPFTGFEVAEIMAMLRRGLFPVAYGPLLESPVRNLRVIGLNIVRQFGIEEAERALLRMVGNDPVSELCHEAIYTLASMHLPITRREIVRRVWSMDRGERKALCRRLAVRVTRLQPSAVSSTTTRRVTSIRSCRHTKEVSHATDRDNIVGPVSSGALCGCGRSAIFRACRAGT